MAAADLVEEQTPGAGKWLLLTVLALIFVLVTALAVIGSTHKTRQLFAELQVLQREENELQIHWRQLLVEKNALSSHARVERIARKELDMTPASADTNVVVSQ